MTAFHASAKWRRQRADASTGEKRGTSGGAVQGSSPAGRSTPGWHMHDFAELTRRRGWGAGEKRGNWGGGPHYSKKPGGRGVGGKGGGGVEWVDSGPAAESTGAMDCAAGQLSAPH